MPQYEYDVEERPVPGQHAHSWIAIEQGSGVEIPLPQGGNGAFLGHYPEIAEHIAKTGPQVELRYSRARGNTLDIAKNGTSIWTYVTQGQTIIVRDIPRTMHRFEISG